jgi:penicillin-binding protein 1A
MRMRTALAKSKNMVSIRILQAIGTKYAQDYVTRFGFDANRHPPYLTMALGAGSVTAWQMARAFSVFANGGYLLQPYFIEKIVDDRGDPQGIAHPQHAGDERLRVIDARNAFLIDSMLQDVTRYGTAARARRLGRNDIAGKTGTTNEFVDAWFCGFQPTLVGITWVGFDQPKTLGRNQTGSAVALPVWIDFMQHALKGVPEMELTPPPGVVLMQTGPDPTIPDDKPVPEYFYQENIPVEPPAAPQVVAPAATPQMPPSVAPAVPPAPQPAQ